MADIIVGALSGGIVNWTVDQTYSLETNLHNLAVALADLLSAGISAVAVAASTLASRPEQRRAVTLELNSDQALGRALR